MFLNVMWTESKESIVDIKLAMKLVEELSKKSSVSNITFKQVE